MAINDFYPFQENKKITLAQWNELFDAIRDGSFFLVDAPLAEGVASLAERVTVLETENAFLRQIKGRSCAKNQYALVALQSQVTLTHVPATDSEQVFLNGVSLSKTDVDSEFTGDYSIDGKVITLHLDVSREIVDGDIITVSYQYEV